MKEPTSDMSAPKYQVGWRPTTKEDALAFLDNARMLAPDGTLYSRYKSPNSQYVEIYGGYVEWDQKLLAAARVATGKPYVIAAKYRNGSSMWDGISGRWLRPAAEAYKRDGRGTHIEVSEKDTNMKESTDVVFRIETFSGFRDGTYTSLDAAIAARPQQSWFRVVQFDQGKPSRTVAWSNGRGRVERGSEPYKVLEASTDLQITKLLIEGTLSDMDKAIGTQVLPEFEGVRAEQAELRSRIMQEGLTNDDWTKLGVIAGLLWYKFDAIIQLMKDGNQTAKETQQTLTRVGDRLKP